jgi:hypothetical protein
VARIGKKGGRAAATGAWDASASPPLSDLLYSNPYDVLRARIQFGLYLGLHDVDGVRCHHLASKWDFGVRLADVLFTPMIPHGATVSSLPPNASSQSFLGTTYFVSNGTYYKPFYSGSSVVYQVVTPPF